MELPFTVMLMILHMAVAFEDQSDITKLVACFAAIRNWLSTNYLLLNLANTEMMMIGPAKLSHLHDNFTLSLW